MQTRRARSRIEAQGAITDDRDKHFDKCGCRCHVLPAPAPHLQDKCASVSYVSPCSIVAIIITSQSCALTIRAFNGDPRTTPTLRVRMVPGPHHALSPCRDAAFRVGARYPGERPTRVPGLLSPGSWRSGPTTEPQSERPLLICGSKHWQAHALTRPLRLPRSF